MSPSGRQTDTCQGDSGGPAIATINGTEFVTGVVSGGPEGCIGLTDYSSIVDKAGWIAQILGGSNGAATGNSNTSSGSQPASPPSGQDRSNSCQYAHDNMCDEPTYCSVGTDTADCQGGAPGQTPPSNPPSGMPPSSPPSNQDPANSCQYANDNMCDEPYFCQVGTDTADCQGVVQGQNPPPSATPPSGQVGADSCTYARNGTCDEPFFCQMGTDTSDCQNTPQAQAPPSGSTPAGGQAGADSCTFARDGTCDEPFFCQTGTDTSDCQGGGQTQSPPSGGSRPSNGSGSSDPANSCQYAHDNMCDEPTYCMAGTDTADCAASRSNRNPSHGRSGALRTAAPMHMMVRVMSHSFVKWARTKRIARTQRLKGSRATISGASNANSMTNSAGSCPYANDGECDEPTYCPYGTDGYDCFSDSILRF